MNAAFFDYYNTELHHIRHMCREFALAYPKVAGRLNLDDPDFEYVDPYVERLLEGFAYLSARVQVKLDAEFPRFSQALLNTVYPHYLAPVPAMVMAQFEPDYTVADLADGVELPRGTTLRTGIVPRTTTACQFHTAHSVRLWPVTVDKAQYAIRDLSTLGLPASVSGKAGLLIRLATVGGIPFQKLGIEDFSLYLRGIEDVPYRLYHQLFAHTTQVVIKRAGPRGAVLAILPPSCIRQQGFDDADALLPTDLRVFSGYRLLQEYFVFPRRFLFVQLTELAKSVRACPDSELEIVCLFSEADVGLEREVNREHLVPYCSPAINLFRRRADRINLSERFSEHQLVVDRTRPNDFEVYSVERVVGYDMRNGAIQDFPPFYAARDWVSETSNSKAFHCINRVQRMLSEQERLTGPRLRYPGSEVYISLVDANSAPYNSNLQQLGAEVSCSNRDLPSRLDLRQMESAFSLESPYPVARTRCLEGPTEPRPSFAEGEFTWRLISHMSLNYLSLVNTTGGEGAQALRELLRLYIDPRSVAAAKQIEGLVSIGCRPVLRQVKSPGPVAFARGLEVSVTFDESAFAGSGAILLGAVLERFFSGYVAINSFTETIIRSLERGDLKRWPTRMGRQNIL